MAVPLLACDDPTHPRLLLLSPPGRSAQAPPAPPAYSNLRSLWVTLASMNLWRPSPGARGSHRRLLLLCGLLLALAAVYVTSYPPPEDSGAEPNTYVARLWYRLHKVQPPRKPDVVFVPTPQKVVDRMLELAELKTNDLLYDLGCGDGRFVVTAAKRYGIRAVGVDIDPERVADSRRNVRTNGVGHLVTIREADIFTLDFGDATVVTLYLLPELNFRLKPRLARLPPGTRILSHAFEMRGAKPLVKEDISPDGSFFTVPVYKWVVPWEEEPGEPAPGPGAERDRQLNRKTGASSGQPPAP